MSPVAFGLMGIGTVLVSRPLCHTSRFAGAAMIGVGVLLVATPTLARDETLLAKDNSEVACTVSRRDLTRISLKDDRFASLSKLTGEADVNNFSVVHEPTRGDIYISLPEGYARPDVSFFGTSAKGYVYKFACRVAGETAHQVFVENRELLADAPAATARASRGDVAIALVQAMYASRPLDGFELRQPDLAPVRVGDLRVRMIAEYRGPELSGRILRVENGGDAAIGLDEAVIAPSTAVAVSVAQPILQPGQATTAYIVLPTGAAK